MYRLSYEPKSHFSGAGWVIYKDYCGFVDALHPAYWFPWKPTKKQIRHAINGKLR